jgi:hypothetical protein
MSDTELTFETGMRIRATTSGWLYKVVEVEDDYVAVRGVDNGGYQRHPKSVIRDDVEENRLEVIN